MHRNGAVVIVVHSLKEKFDLIFGDVGVNMSKKLGKLLEVKLLMSFEA